MSYLPPAVCTILAFGGVRATARAIKRTPGAVSMWKRKGMVPTDCLREVYRQAQERGYRLTAEELILGRDSDETVTVIATRIDSLP